MLLEVETSGKAVTLFDEEGSLKKGYTSHVSRSIKSPLKTIFESIS